jgi:hypothetical protein
MLSEMWALIELGGSDMMQTLTLWLLSPFVSKRNCCEQDDSE